MAIYDWAKNTNGNTIAFKAGEFASNIIADILISKGAATIAESVELGQFARCAVKITDKVGDSKHIADDIVRGTDEAIDEVAETLMNGAQYTKIGRIKTLKPNISYKTTSGYLYKTDSLGRIDSVEGTLKLGKGNINKHAQKVAGRGDRLADDHGGHLIANIFDGSGNLDNLVPMNGNLNQGAWKTMENTWADALKSGKKVNVTIDTIYEGNSKRPTEFFVEYFIDGKKHEKIFKI